MSGHVETVSGLALYLPSEKERDFMENLSFTLRQMYGAQIGEISVYQWYVVCASDNVWCSLRFIVLFYAAMSPSASL